MLCLTKSPSSLAGKKTVFLRVFFDRPRVDSEVARVGSRVDIPSHFLNKPPSETGKTKHSLRMMVSPLFVGVQKTSRNGPYNCQGLSRLIKARPRLCISAPAAQEPIGLRSIFTIKVADQSRSCAQGRLQCSHTGFSKTLRNGLRIGPPG